MSSISLGFFFCQLPALVLDSFLLVYIKSFPCDNLFHLYLKMSLIHLLSDNGSFVHGFLLCVPTLFAKVIAHGFL